VFQLIGQFKCLVFIDFITILAHETGHFIDLFLADISHLANYVHKMGDQNGHFITILAHETGHFITLFQLKGRHIEGLN
jgi:hypothetical protein